MDRVRHSKLRVEVVVAVAIKRADGFEIEVDNNSKVISLQTINLFYHYGDLDFGSLDSQCHS
jgi:hypothetical protein